MTAARCYPNIGGVERHVEYIRRELVKIGHTVEVLEVGEGLSALRSFPNLVTALRCGSFDVIHAHDFVASIVTWAAARYSRTKKDIYATVHGYEGYPLRPVYVLAHRFAHRIARKVIAIGSYIDRWYGTRSALVVHGGVDDVLTTPEPESPVIVFISRLATDTNSMEVVEALVALAAEYPEAHFRIYGFGPLALSVNEKCHASAVQFGGAISNVNDVLATSSIVVANSYLAILEAFSRGKPVISYYGNPLKRDYLEEIATASKAAEVVGSVQELQRVIGDLLDDSSLRATLSKRALAYAQRHQWSWVARDYLRLWGVA